MPSLLRHGLSLLRAPAIELGFALRATLRWQRGQPTMAAGEPSGQLCDWAPRHQRAGLAARARQLAREYDLESLATAATGVFACQNFARLAVLQRPPIDPATFFKEWGNGLLE